MAAGPIWAIWKSQVLIWPEKWSINVSAMHTNIWRCQKRLQNAVFGTFLDVNHYLEIVTSSNLLLRHPNTSVDVVEGLKEANSDKSRNKPLPGRPGNQDFGSEWLNIVFSGTFLDVNRSPGKVKSPNLFLRHPSTFADATEVLEQARSDKSRNTSLAGRPGNMI